MNEIKSAAKTPLFSELLKRRFNKQPLANPKAPSIAEMNPRQSSRYRQPAETSRLRGLFPKFPLAKNTSGI